MPHTGISETLNGATVIASPPTDKADKVDKVDRYRPEASIERVYEEVMRSFASVATTALHNAGNFVYLAEHYDRDAGTAVRMGHLVDAAECAEIALTHLGQLKALVSHRLHTEDERISEYPF